MTPGRRGASQRGPMDPGGLRCEQRARGARRRRGGAAPRRRAPLASPAFNCHCQSGLENGQPQPAGAHTRTRTSTGQPAKATSVTSAKRARLVASMPSVAVKFGECHAPYLTPAMMVALPSSDWLITDPRCLNSGATRAALTPISMGGIASHGKTSRIFTIVHAPKLGLQPTRDS